MRECNRIECHKEAVSVLAIGFFQPGADGKGVGAPLGKAIIDCPVCEEHLEVALKEPVETLLETEQLAGITLMYMKVLNKTQLALHVLKVEFEDPDYQRLLMMQQRRLN